MKLSFPPLTYGPFRNSVPDILNVEAGPLAPLPPTPWRVIAREIVKKCDSLNSAKSNLAVAKGLHDFAREQNIVGSRYEFPPLPLGVSEKVTYWSPAVIALGKRRFVPFFDPRRAKG